MAAVHAAMTAAAVSKQGGRPARRPRPGSKRPGVLKRLLGKAPRPVREDQAEDWW